MCAFVQQFLDAAAATLELAGPVALIADDSNSRAAGHWLRGQFAGQLVLECRVPAGRRDDDEFELGDLPVENESLRTLLCLDLLHRFEETAALLRLALPLLAPGGMALITANIGNSRPQEGLSRMLTPVGLERLVANLDAAILGWQGDPDFPDSLFLVASRSPVPPRFANAAGRFIDTFQLSHARQRSRTIGPPGCGSGSDVCSSGQMRPLKRPVPPPAVSYCICPARPTGARHFSVGRRRRTSPAAGKLCAR